MAQSPVAVLLGMVACYSLLFGRLVWRQHAGFGTFGFDLGIFDQGIWLLSRFREPFVTVRGLNYFGNHINIITVLFVPFYWLGGGAGFLTVFQAAAIASGAIPIWLLARDRFENAWLALGLAAAYLLYPSLEWITWWQFHPDALAITPFIFAYWFATRRAWKPFWICIVLVLLCKEDTSLSLFALGLLVAWKYSRRVGLATSALALAWLALSTRVLIPLANGGLGPFYEGLYGDFGTSVASVARTVILKPGKVLDLALQNDRLTYFRQLLAPVAMLAILVPGVLLVALPQVIANIISVQPYTYQIKYQYSSLVGAVILIAATEACATLGHTMGRRRFLVGLVAATALATNVAWSPSPLSVHYRSGIWAQPTARAKVIEAGLSLIPGDASVAATYYFVPHLTHRSQIYEYPNPWSPANWGVRGENRRDPATVAYLAVDTRALGDHGQLYRELTVPGGEFEVVFAREGVEVARRRSLGARR